MGIKYKTVKDKLPQMEKALKGLCKSKVKVGALSGSHSWLAGIHEY